MPKPVQCSDQRQHIAKGLTTRWRCVLFVFFFFLLSFFVFFRVVYQCHRNAFDSLSNSKKKTHKTRSKKICTVWPGGNANRVESDRIGSVRVGPGRAGPCRPTGSARGDLIRKAARRTPYSIYPATPHQALQNSSVAHHVPETGPR